MKDACVAWSGAALPENAHFHDGFFWTGGLGFCERRAGCVDFRIEVDEPVDDGFALFVGPLFGASGYESSHFGWSDAFFGFTDKGIDAEASD